MNDKIALARTLDKIMPESHKKMADERIAHCNSCDKFNLDSRKCLMCGCYMDLKVYIPDVQCPLKKW